MTRETLGDMARKAIKKEWAVGDPIEFKHLVEMSSRLEDRDAQMVGTIWNAMQSAMGRVKTLGAQVAKLEAAGQVALQAIADANRERREAEACVKPLEVAARAMIAAHGNQNAELIARDAMLDLIERRGKGGS